VKWKLRFFGGGPDDDVDTVDLTEQKVAARAALAKSTQALAEARRRGPEVARVSRSLREIRAKNHFAEMIQDSFRGSTS
jgi:hypothetical protein